MRDPSTCCVIHCTSERNMHTVHAPFTNKLSSSSGVLSRQSFLHLNLSMRLDLLATTRSCAILCNCSFVLLTMGLFAESMNTISRRPCTLLTTAATHCITGKRRTGRKQGETHRWAHARENRIMWTMWCDVHASVIRARMHGNDSLPEKWARTRWPEWCASGGHSS